MPTLMLVMLGKRYVEVPHFARRLTRLAATCYPDA